MTLDQAIPIVGGACLGIGALAKSWPRFPNAYIPTLVAIAGTVLVPAMCGWTALHAVSGFIAGLSATGIHQGTRQVANDVRQRTGHTEKFKR